MKSWLLAWRNLARNRDRSVAALMTTLIGAAAILLFGGFIRFVAYGLQTGYVQYAGHFQIQRYGYAAYGSGNPARFGIAGYGAIMDKLRTDPQLGPMIEQLTPTIEMTGVLGYGDRGTSRSVVVRGVVVDEQNRLRQWNEYGLAAARDNRLSLDVGATDGAVIGTGVARVLRLCDELSVSSCPRLPDEPARIAPAVPDYLQALSAREQSASSQRTGGQPHVQLLAATAEGTPNVAQLRVVKAEMQGAKELDDVFVITHLAQTQRLLFSPDDPRVTGITVQLKRTELMPAARARMEALLGIDDPSPELDIRDFQKLFPFYGQALRMFDVIFGFIAVLIAAVVIFTVGNTIRMAVIDRTVEIGTLRAIGLTRASIRTLFVQEGLTLGVIGTLLGLVAALGLAGLVNLAEISWLPPGQARPVVVTVLVWGEGMLLALTCTALIAAAGASAWWAARTAAAKNIVDALRHA